MQAQFASRAMHRLVSSLEGTTFFSMGGPGQSLPSISASGAEVGAGLATTQQLLQLMGMLDVGRN